MHGVGPSRQPGDPRDRRKTVYFSVFTPCLRPPRASLARLRRGGAVVALTALTALTACTTYPDRVERTADAVNRGELGVGVMEMSRAARVRGANDMPGRVSGRDASLALLERGSLLQAMRRWDDSSRDLQAAASSLGVMDRGATSAAELGDAVYGLPHGGYALTPTEQLNLAALHLLNQLARNDLAAARDAARDFTVLRRKMHDTHGGTEHEPQHRGDLGRHVGLLVGSDVGADAFVGVGKL